MATLGACVLRGLISLALFTSAVQAGADGDKRQLRLHDVLSKQSVESVSISTDGRSIAFVVGRGAPVQSGRSANWSLFSYALGDLWVQLAPHQPALRLTDGEDEVAGAWYPAWSPSGKQLAYTSSQGGVTHLAVWDSVTGEVRNVCTRLFQPFFGQGGLASFHWLDERRVVCSVVAEGEPSLLESYMGRTARFAMDAWSKANRGELSVSAVDSMIFDSHTNTEYGGAKINLMVADVAGGDMRFLTEALPTAAPTWSVSPDGRFVLVAPPQSAQRSRSDLMRMGFPYDVELLSVAGERVLLDRRLPKQVLLDSVRWSKDGKRLSFFAHGDACLNPLVLYGPHAVEVMPDEFEACSKSIENPAQLYLADLSARKLRLVPTDAVDLGGLGFPSYSWWTNDELVVYAARKRYGGSAEPAVSRGGSLMGYALGPQPDREWWAVGANNKLRPLDLTKVPFEATPADRHGRQEAMSPKDSARIRAIQTSAGRLADRAQLVASAGTSGVYIEETGRSTLLWRARIGQQPEHLHSINTHLEEVVQPECRIVEYNSINGDPLRAGLCLPIDYQIGTRPPLVVALYPGAQVREDWVQRGGLYDDFKKIYPQAGYAYLEVSMLPRNNLPGLRDEEGWSSALFLHGLIPAIDKIVAMGLADEQQVFLTGVSGGGWATMSLLTQTTRFRAATAVAAGAGPGVSPFDNGGGIKRAVVDRYSPSPHDGVTPNYSFYHQFRGGLPWWRDGDRQRSHNPLYQAYRVQTPIMLIHGDLDGIPMDNSEDFFRALASMRKPAQLVRYWGEGHGIAIPANYIDYWQRMLAWFDKWGDIARTSSGTIIYEGERAKSRNGAAALEPQQLARFDLFDGLQ